MNNLNSVFQFAFVGVYVPATISFGDNFNCKGIHLKNRKRGGGLKTLWKITHLWYGEASQRLLCLRELVGIVSPASQPKNTCNDCFQLCLTDSKTCIKFATHSLLHCVSPCAEMDFIGAADFCQRLLHLLFFVRSDFVVWQHLTNRRISKKLSKKIIISTRV